MERTGLTIRNIPNLKRAYLLWSMLGIREASWSTKTFSFERNLLAFAPSTFRIAVIRTEYSVVGLFGVFWIEDLNSETPQTLSYKLIHVMSFRTRLVSRVIRTPPKKKKKDRMVVIHSTTKWSVYSLSIAESRDAELSMACGRLWKGNVLLNNVNNLKIYFLVFEAREFV